MKHSADTTRSPRQRAGSRRNKRLRNVGTFESDCRVIFPKGYGKTTPITYTAPPPPDFRESILRMTLRSLANARRMGRR